MELAGIGAKEAALRRAREQASLSPRGPGGDGGGGLARAGAKEASGAGTLARLSRAVLLLEQSRDLREVASIRDRALAAETYARAQQLADEAVHHATEVRVRAARKAGELLADVAEKGEPKVRGGDRRFFKSLERTLKLDDLGVTP